MIVIGIDRQIDLALELLAPPQHQLAECRAHIKEVLDVMAAVAQADEHAGITKRARRQYSAALERLLETTENYALIGGALTIPLDVIKRAVDSDRKWSTHWTPPSRYGHQKCAVAMAYELLSCWRPDAISKSRHGEWHQLTVILYGNMSANLYRHLRTFHR